MIYLTIQPQPFQTPQVSMAMSRAMTKFGIISRSGHAMSIAAAEEILNAGSCSFISMRMVSKWYLH
ncbi:MAG: hypothetical protein ACLRX7_07160 [Acutalibacteraceae bacterium]